MKNTGDRGYLGGLFGRLCKCNLIRNKGRVGWNLMEKESDDFGRTEKGLT